MEGHDLHHHHHHHHHDGSDEDDDDDSEDDEMDEDDDDEDVEVIDELGELGQPGFDNVGEGDGWEAESDEEHDIEAGEILVEEPVDQIIRALGADEVHDEIDDERDDGFVDDEGEDDEDDDGEDDELDEEDALIQAEMDDEEEYDASTPWGWAEETGDAPMMTRAGQPARGGWYTLGGAPRGDMGKYIKQYNLFLS